MPLDHYVPQVYLRQWRSLERDSQQVLVTRKSDLLEFPANPSSICRIENGSTNQYFDDERILEKFLLDIEPLYNHAVGVFRQGDLTRNEVYVVAGLMAYLVHCSPTGVRLAKEYFDALILAELTILDRAGVFPPAPEALGRMSVSELVRDGLIQPTIDEKYPHSLGIEVLTTFISYLVDAEWQVLVSDKRSGSFLTSDYPLPILIPTGMESVTRIFPLAPDLAVVVKGKDRGIEKLSDKVTFENFRYKRFLASAKLIRMTNDLIVKAAEDLIISNARPPWLRAFVAKRADYKLINTIKRVETPRGEKISGALRYCRN
ncbi:MAG: DUF4238 domain-containing protein [Janthinobacterium lividum]